MWKTNPSRATLAMQACEALIDALDRSGGAPFPKRRMMMLSAIDKACAATGVRFEEHPEALVALLGDFGSDMADFNNDARREE